MAEPTLAALLTRIEVLERHVQRLEQAAKITRWADPYEGLDSADRVRAIMKAGNAKG